MNCLGIDPGLKGGLVAVDGAGVLLAREMPVIETRPKRREVDLHVMRRILVGLRELGPFVVALEQAQAVFQGGGHASFVVGRDWGGICGLLVALEIPFRLWPPKTWQKQIGIRTPKGGDAASRKRAIKGQVIQVVRSRLPSLNLMPGRKRKPHDGLSDAAGIALAHIDVEGLRARAA